MPEHKTVYEHPFGRDGIITVTLPIGLHQPVLFDLQAVEGLPQPVLWIEQWLPEEGDTFRTEEVTYQYFGTGHLIPADATYVDSYIDRTYGWVWHCYRMSEPTVPLSVSP